MLNISVGAIFLGVLIGITSPFAAHVISPPSPNTAATLTVWHARFNGTVKEFTGGNGESTLTMKTSRITPDLTVPDTVQFRVDEGTMWRTMDFYISGGEVDRVITTPIEKPKNIPVDARISVLRDLSTQEDWHAATVYLLRRFE